MSMRVLAGIVLSSSLVFSGCGGGSPEPAPGAAPSPEAATPAAGAAVASIRNVSVEEAEELLKVPDSVVVLDVRTPDEFAEGHLAGATNINFTAPDFAARLEGLDRNGSYLIHCRSGGRGGRALAVMEEMGFKSVYHLNKGMAAWEAAGKPVVKE